METIVILALIAVAACALGCYANADNALQDTRVELASEQKKNQELLRILETKEQEERAQLQENLELAEQYAADLEEEKKELVSGYALMATTIETLQAEMEALIKHTENHCQRLDLLEQGRPIRIRFAVMPDLNYDDYQSEEPYSESDCPTLTPLPEYVQTAEIEGLDTL